MFSIGKVHFSAKCLFGRIGRLKFFWEKKFGCRIQKISHFLCQKNDFFYYFCTPLVNFSPKKTNRFGPPLVPKPVNYTKLDMWLFPEESYKIIATRPRAHIPKPAPQFDYFSPRVVSHLCGFFCKCSHRLWPNSEADSLCFLEQSRPLKTAWAWVFSPPSYAVKFSGFRFPRGQKFWGLGFHICN